MRHVSNFNAGPAGLPRSALELAQREFLDFEGTGISILEHSHRGPAYEAVHQEVLKRTRTLLAVADTHDILLLQGGASGMFALVPMNFLPPGKVADYILTGDWSKKAMGEAEIVGKTRVAGRGDVDGQFVRIPEQGALDLKADAAYVHITSNNTIFGTQYHSFPSTGQVPLVADMSSDILSRSFDVSKFALIYAGAQKNLGPSGVTLVIVDKNWLRTARTDIPKIFRFQTHAEAGSLYHTPPTFAVYLMRNVLRWIEQEGGLSVIAKRNQNKAEKLYAAIEQSAGYYRCPVEKAARSQMNVVFRLPSEALEKKFAKESEAADLIGLKGHRSVGGMRASLYNAVSIEDVERLVKFMQNFQAGNAA